MLNVNMDSIMRKAGKVVNSREFKKEKESFIGDVLSGNISVNFNEGTIYSATEAAEKFIEVLRNHINTSGLSGNAAGALQDISFGTPTCAGSKCTIKVFFDGDMHRESLNPEKYPGGIDRIDELLDQGVGHKMKPVYGQWNGKYVRSRTTIPGAYFIDAAIRDFMISYGKKYNVVDIDVEYEH